jgi:hypothetical protein
MQGFLYLFIGGRDVERTPAEAEDNMKAWVSWMDDLRSAGAWIGGHPLENGGKTIVGIDKKVTDGPFAETKELVGGFIQVNAENLDAAVEHAKNCPIYPSGGRVEVRPIHVM